MQDYRKLVVWQKAHKLVLDADAWPVRDQMRPAAISIPSNIAEGTGRSSDPDFRRFLFHSLGSTNELEYDFILARDLWFVPVPLYGQRTGQIEEVRRMLSSLVVRLTK